jgi:hypothetical protein
MKRGTMMSRARRLRSWFRGGGCPDRLLDKAKSAVYVNDTTCDYAIFLPDFNGDHVARGRVRI